MSRVLAVAVLLVGFAVGWQLQAWRLGEQLAQRDRLHSHTLAEIQRAAVNQARRDHEQRIGLERELQAESQQQYRRRTDAEQNVARLRDRLATADLRLSVLVDAVGGADRHAAVPAATAAGRLVDGGRRAELDPATAQRLLTIGERGDRAIIALSACQGYVQALITSRE